MWGFMKEKKYHYLVRNYIEQETDFHFIKELGVGSYGVAYLLLHSKSGNQYVLKRMKTKHLRKKKLHEKFQQEISMLNEIGIPNTPSVYTQGNLSNIPFYIMDFVDGKTFEQAIFEDGVTFTLAQSLVITKQLLELVMTLHEKGIIHRDLRIPNILINGEGLHIIDFGLATYLDPNLKIDNIDNPKKAENHISDLYFVGHFLLFLLYSNFTPTERKERSWQEELQLPIEVIDYIERLLTLRSPFSSTKEALSSIPEDFLKKT